jgi:hypothetical protein
MPLEAPVTRATVPSSRSAIEPSRTDHPVSFTVASKIILNNGPEVPA